MRFQRVMSCIIIVMLFITGVGFRTADAAQNQPVPASMKQVAENGSLRLFVNPETTEIAVLVKDSGTVWYSNPQDREKDIIANGEVKTGLGAQIVLEYFANRNEVKKKDSFNDCVQNKNFKIIEIKDGIRIEYTIGSSVRTRDDLPGAISKDRFEKTLLNRISSEEDKKSILKRYTLTSLANAKSQPERDEMLKTTPGLEKQDFYILDKYTPQFEINTLYGILNKSGYSMEDLIKDNEESGKKAAVKETESFFIPLEYKLDGKNLVATINCSEILSPKSFPLTGVRLFENFGAAGLNDNGYMFVPDGSGALIYLNNQKTKLPAFNMKLYGEDGAVKVTEKRQYTKQACLPVYGLKKNDTAFLALIEEGDTHATISADISGRLISYNTIGAYYNIREYDEVLLNDPSNQTGRFNVFNNKSYSGNIKVRYFFLDADKANYSGMANTYRDYLVDKGALKIHNESEELPFFLDILGAVKYKKTFLGIPISKVEPLTTFDEATKILNHLKANEIANIKVKYSGWFNGGINHTIPDKVKVDSVLGGKNGFDKFHNYVDQNRIDVYYDTAIQNVYDRFPSFMHMFEASKYVFRETAVKYPFNLVQMTWNTKMPYSFILAPSEISKYVRGYLTSLEKIGAKGVSFRDLSNQLNSNFNSEMSIDREQSKRIVVDNLQKVKERGFEVALNEANAYAMPYADTIFEMPLEDSKYLIVDKSIPFYPMVVHGYIPYAGIPLNSGNGYRDNLLKSIEAGAGIYYNWTYKDSSVLKTTSFNNYYATSYKYWVDAAITDYRRIKDQLGDIVGRRMLKHEIVSENVVKVIYEGGTTIYVNYGNNPETVEGTKVNAKDYSILKGGVSK